MSICFSNQSEEKIVSNINTNIKHIEDTWHTRQKTKSYEYIHKVKIAFETYVIPMLKHTNIAQSNIGGRYILSSLIANWNILRGNYHYNKDEMPQSLQNTLDAFNFNK